MAISQISFITKNPRQDPYNPILEVGGPFPDGYGSIWRCSLQTAVNAALHEGVQFFTMHNGHTAAVEVARGPSGALHLRTVPDGTGQNNLLSLDNFPAPSLRTQVYSHPAGLIPTAPRGLPGLLSHR